MSKTREVVANCISTVIGSWKDQPLEPNCPMCGGSIDENQRHSVAGENRQLQLNQVGDIGQIAILTEEKIDLIQEIIELKMRLQIQETINKNVELKLNKDK